MTQLNIPDDWDGTTWECYFLTFPKSVQWDAILRGLISIPTRGRFWEAQSGSILAAQAVGREIVKRNQEMDCNDLITVLQEIRDNIDQVKVVQEQNVSITTQMSSNIAVSAQAQASAYAWSQAFAQSTVGVKIINNVSLEMRPLEPTVLDPPNAAEETPTGITATPQSTDTQEQCKRCFWFVYAQKTIYDYWYDTSVWVQGSILALLGAVSDAVSVAALSGDPQQKAILIPAARLLQVAHLLSTFYYEGIIQECMTDLRDWMDANFADIICICWNGLQANTNTLVIQQNIIADYLSFSTSGNAVKFANVIPLFANLSSLAALYYVSTYFPTLPSIPAEFGGDAFCILNCIEGG